VHEERNVAPFVPAIAESLAQPTRPSLDLKNLSDFHTHQKQMSKQSPATALNFRAREFFPTNGNPYVVARFRAARQRSDVATSRRGWTGSEEVKETLAKIAAFNSAMRNAHVVTGSDDVALRPIALRASPWTSRVAVGGARHFYFLLAVSERVMKNAAALSKLQSMFEVHARLQLDVANMRGPTSQDVRTYYKTHNLSFQFELPIPLHLSSPDSIRRMPEWSWDLPRDRFFADLSVGLMASAVLMSLEVTATDAETLLSRVETTLRHGPRVGLGVTPSILRAGIGEQLDAWTRVLSDFDATLPPPTTHLNAVGDGLVKQTGATRARSPLQARCGVDPNASAKRAKLDADAADEPDALVRSALEIVMNEAHNKAANRQAAPQVAQPAPAWHSQPKKTQKDLLGVSLVSPEALHVKNLTEIANLSAKSHLDTDLMPGSLANASPVSALSCVFHPSSPHILSQIWQPVPLATVR
jgi:hypothetical protein